METVVVKNNSGQTLLTHGVRVKPLRETNKDQEFEFKTPLEASDFADHINSHPHKGLKALYAGAEGGELAGTTSETAVAALLEELKEMSDKDLKAKCKEMKFSGYSSLKGDDLVNLIVANTQAENVQSEQE